DVRCAAEQAELIPNSDGEAEQDLPVLPLQEGLLFHAALADGGIDAYVGQQVFELVGAVDVERMREAVAGLFRRHEGLRVCFRQVSSGSWVQVVARTVTTPFDVVDLRDSDDAERELDRKSTRLNS